MKLIAKTHNPLFDIILIGLLTLVFFTALLGGRPYSAPSESRYVEIGREMAESGNYVTPRLNYVKYFEKPPLFYWVQAAWTKLAGVNFFNARIPTTFFSVLLCLLTYGLGRMLYGRLAGALSAIVIATSLYLFALSRIVLLDVPVSVFLVGTLTAFLYAVNAPSGKARCWVLYAMYVAAAGAVLTKGLIGIVLPGAVIFLWFVFTGRWSLLKEMKIPTGTILFLLISVPWHIMVWQHNPEHPQFYFIHEHLQRYTTTVHGRYQPFWFFAAVLVAGLFPWVVFAYPALRTGLKGSWAERKTNDKTLFLALWIGFIFLFFSASDSKLIPYILPIFPPIAAMFGDYFARIWQERPIAGTKKNTGFGLGVLLMVIILLAIAALPLILSSILSPDGKVTLALAQGGDDLGHLSGVALVSAIALFVAYIQGRKRHVILVLIVIAAAIAQLGDMVAANYNKDSMEEFAQVIRSVEKPGDETATYDNYYQDMPIYLGHRVTVVHWKGELEFGTEHEDTSAWMIGYDEFWKRWMTPNHVMFVVMRQDAVERIIAEKKQKPEDLHMYLISQQGRNMFFTNTPSDQLKQRQK